MRFPALRWPRFAARPFLLLLALLVAAPARAGWLDWTEAQPGDSLALNLPADVALLGGSFLLWGGSQSLRSAIGPQRCDWCDGADNLGLPGQAGDGRGSLNGVDAFFHDALTGWLVSRKSADSISSGLAYGVTPLFSAGAAIFATGPHASGWAGARDLVIVLEAVGVQGFLGQAIKFGVARKRPFVRYGHGTNGATADEGSTYDVNDPDSHFSTFSGHTSETAAFTIAAAMCATLQDSRAAPWLWAGAGVLIASTGTLRMVAEKHYFTDVLGGAVLGAASGVTIPLLHRAGGLLGKDLAGLQVSGGPEGVQIAWGGKF